MQCFPFQIPITDEAENIVDMGSRSPVHGHCSSRTLRYHLLSICFLDTNHRELQVIHSSTASAAPRSETAYHPYHFSGQRLFPKPPSTSRSHASRDDPLGIVACLGSRPPCVISWSNHLILAPLGPFEIPVSRYSCRPLRGRLSEQKRTWAHLLHRDRTVTLIQKGAQNPTSSRCATEAAVPSDSLSYVTTRLAP